MKTLLVLGGTREADVLVRALTKTYQDMNLILSLAGATRNTATATLADTPWRVNVGGFGGVEGLVDFLNTKHIDAIIDATHPFAQLITQNAIAACEKTALPYLRLERPQWVMPQDADVVFVPDAKEAARLVARTSKAAFLTIGRKALGAFRGMEKTKLLVRLIETPRDEPILSNATFIIARPPFSVDEEAALMRRHDIDTLVTKASGGDATRAKIDAAARIKARIVLLRRPPPPEAEQVFSIDKALDWVARQT